MTTRDELIEVGLRALGERWGGDAPDTDEEFVVTILDAVEPPIRADERKPQIWHGVYRAGYDAALDALHAKVLMLPATGKSPEGVINDVLALFDGEGR